MPGVLAAQTGLQDILLLRGNAERVGVKWEQSEDGTAFAPVDLRAWTAKLELVSPFGEVWLTLPCTTYIDGFAICDVPWDALTADVWAGRRSGDWRIVGTAPDGHRERLAYGNLRID